MPGLDDEADGVADGRRHQRALDAQRERGFADAAVPAAIAGFYPQAVTCDAGEHAAFVGNCIALSAETVWMSGNAAAALSDAHRNVLSAAGFRVEAVALEAIEAAGGSLRCCIGEIY